MNGGRVCCRRAEKGNVGKYAGSKRMEVGR